MSATATPLRPTPRAWIGWLAAGIGAAALTGVGLAWAGTAAPRAQSGGPDAFMAWHAGRAGVKTTASGLQYQVLKPAQGPAPTDADIALINYKGTLRDGRVFDAAQRQPMPVARVVPGFAEALKLMPRGSSYRIWIPPRLGYGDQAKGDAIPANSVLIFDIDMIDFRSMAEIEAQLRAMQGARGAPGADDALPPAGLPPR